MRGTRILPLVAFAVLAAAAPARAQNCVAGQLWTCFSYQIFATPISGGTSVSLWVRNTSTAGPSGQASWLTALAIYSPPDAATAYGLTVTTNGSVVATPNLATAGGEWVLSTPPPSLGLPGSLVLASSGNSTTGGAKQGDIQGCGTTGGATIYFGTCAGTGSTGWVVFNFKTTGNWSGTFDMGAKFQTTLGSFECTTGAPSKSTPSCTTTTTTVTPEPITLSLLATGLVGVGGVGLIRRRRKDESDLS